MKIMSTLAGALLLAFGLSVSAAPNSDGEILDIVRTANNAELAASEVAATKASNPKVREFAATMLKDHKKNNNEADSVTKKANVNFTTSDRSTNLKADAETKMAALHNAPGNSRDFDRTYIEQQIAMHKDLLTDLEKNLIPNAKDAGVKTYLQKTKSHVESHLSEATKILSSL